MIKTNDEMMNENKLRREFIDELSKEYSSWPDAEKAEIHPERFFVRESEEQRTLTEPNCFPQIGTFQV